MIVSRMTPRPPGSRRYPSPKPPARAPPGLTGHPQSRRCVGPRTPCRRRDRVRFGGAAGRLADSWSGGSRPPSTRCTGPGVARAPDATAWRVRVVAATAVSATVAAASRGRPMLASHARRAAARRARRTARTPHARGARHARRHASGGDRGVPESEDGRKRRVLSEFAGSFRARNGQIPRERLRADPITDADTLPSF